MISCAWAHNKKQAVIIACCLKHASTQEIIYGHFHARAPPNRRGLTIPHKRDKESHRNAGNYNNVIPSRSQNKSSVWHAPLN